MPMVRTAIDEIDKIPICISFIAWILSSAFEVHSVLVNSILQFL
jgi:hypothetical protein